MLSAEYIGIAVAWLCAVLSNIESLKDPKRSKIVISALIILVSSVGSGVAAYTIYTNNQLKPIDSTGDAQVDLKLQEASGGSANGDRAYLVDDETSSVIVLHKSGDSRYEFETSLPIMENGRKLEKQDINDLEGLALDPSNPSILYLTTSHSDNKDGDYKVARNRLIRACIPDDARSVVVLDRISLREALSQLLFEGEHPFARPNSYPDRDAADGMTRVTVMEIEGLAADQNGYLYLGLRAPLANNLHAIIVRIAAKDLFPESANCSVPPLVELREALPEKFSVDEVLLKNKGKYYGIASLDYDPVSKDIVILGNSPNPYSVQPPIYCRWRPDTQPTCVVAPGTREPYWGKPEALLLGPGQDYVTVFIDTDKGLGGSIRYLRSEVGL